MTAEEARARAHAILDGAYCGYERPHFSGCNRLTASELAHAEELERANERWNWEAKQRAECLLEIDRLKTPLTVALEAETARPVTCSKCGHIGPVKVMVTEQMAAWLNEQVTAEAEKYRDELQGDIDRATKHLKEGEAVMKDALKAVDEARALRAELAVVRAEVERLNRCDVEHAGQGRCVDTGLKSRCNGCLRRENARLAGLLGVGR